MRKRMLLMNLVSFPFPARFLPAVCLGVIGMISVFIVYLFATRGL